jgi:uncharacterized protein YqjF (DUF2071 family)
VRLVIWRQHWRDVLFLHFPVSTKELAARLPRELEVDTFDGQAWLSYVFFRLTLRPAWLPLVPGVSSLLELNVRTYVRYRGEPGIYFLRMYADNRLAILASRWLTPLGYEHAMMVDRRSAAGAGHVACQPTAMPGAALAADVEIVAPLIQPGRESLDRWLVERYRLFVAPAAGPMLAADVEHPPWQIAPARLESVDNSLGRSVGLSAEDEPALAHYSPGVTAQFNAFCRVRSPEADGDDRFRS